MADDFKELLNGDEEALKIYLEYLEKYEDHEDVGYEKGHYTALAQEFPFAKDLIEGSATFEGRLDELLVELEDRSGTFAKGKKDFLRDFQEYMTVLRLTCPEYVILGDEEKAKNMVNSKFNNLASKAYLGAEVGGIALIWAGPLFLIEVAVWAAGFLGYSAYIDKAKRGKMLWENKDTIFNSLYNVARDTDQAIGKCFIYEHFENNLERFGKTYQNLEPEEQEAIETKLYNLLEHGALDMAEHELDNYLSGILTDEVDDAGE